jgi:hypothetical protein
MLRNSSFSRTDVPSSQHKGFAASKPNTYIDSVAEIGKRLILVLSPSLKPQMEIHASSAEEAELVKCP